jgi:hypothetical protein
MKIMQGSGLQMKMFEATEGKSVATPDNARYFYFKEPNMMVHIDDSTRELKFHIGEDIDIDNPDINNMMKQLKSMARTNMLDFDIRSFGKHIEPKNYTYKIEQNKEQTMTDNVNEGMGPLSGSSKTSRQTLENVRLIVKHQKAVNEESRGARSRNISSLFVENADGERFKYPFKHLNGARAMARHVSTGGVPSDVVGESGSAGIFFCFGGVVFVALLVTLFGDFDFSMIVSIILCIFIISFFCCSNCSCCLSIFSLCKIGFPFRACAHTTVYTYTGLHLLPVCTYYTSIGFLPWKYRCNLRQIVHCFSQSHVLLFENNRETNLLTELLVWIVPIRYMVLNQH